jgi:hypothetical protein
MNADRRRLLSTSIGGVVAGTATMLPPNALAGSLPPGAFPAHNVRDFGTKGDGATLETEAIQQAIDRAAENRGGIVYFPPGDYLTGTLELRDNVTLYLEAGATIRGSKEQQAYKQRCLVYAQGAANIAIRGRGVIDGNGTSFFFREGGRWMIRDRWRPLQLLQFVRCENLLLEDITLRNSPAYTVHPVDCHLVTIRGISILNGVYEEDGPNTDGIVLDGCSRVRVSDCYVQTGDDSVVLKCTLRRGAPAVCRDITVTNCVLISTEAALKIGSETHGEFRNICFSNCAIRDAGCGIGLWMRDGGLIDGWTVNNISMTLTDGGQPIYLWSYPRSRLPERRDPPEVRTEKPPGLVRNVTISNVIAEADGAVFISGMAEKRLERITLENVRIHMRGAREKPMHADPPYPFLPRSAWGHRHSPYDLFCRYVDHLKLKDIVITWNVPERPEWGSALRCWHVQDLEIDGFAGRQAAGSRLPAIWLREAKKAFIHNCRAPEGTGVFIKLDDGCERITVINNDLSAAQQIAVFAPAVDPKQLFEVGNRLPGT